MSLDKIVEEYEEKEKVSAFDTSWIESRGEWFRLSEEIIQFIRTELEAKREQITNKISDLESLIEKLRLKDRKNAEVS